MGFRFASSKINAAKNGRIPLDNPDLDGYAVTTSDTVDLPNGATTALYVTGSGNVNVNLAGGGTAVLTSLSAGQIIEVAVTRVLATSTTATGIFALYKPGA